MKNKGFGAIIKSTISVFAFLLILSPLTVVRFGVVFAANVGITENRYCTAKIDDDFADDKILVVMNDDADNIVTYTVADFPEAEFIEVKDLTAILKDMLRNGDKEAENDGIFKRENFKSILRLTLKNKGKQNVLDAIHVLEKRSDIISAEPDYTMQPQSIESDKYYESYNQWGLYGNNGIQIEDAWKITKGSFDVKVGIIDTGIDGKHPDLQDRVDGSLSIESPNENTGGPLVDINGHGTHIAGIIGANGNGVMGVNQKVTLISYKINPSIDIYCSEMVGMIGYAIANRVPIINNSLGYDDYTKYKYHKDSYDSLDWILFNYGGLFITSAGNANKCVDRDLDFFPSSFNAPNMIVVGALDHNGRRGEFYDADGILRGSNYGSNVDIYAPGIDIISTVPQINDNMGYKSKSGTSMAAPFVAGVAALLLSIDPDLTGKELKNLILNNCDIITITNPNHETLTVKKLNAYKVVNKLYNSINHAF